MNKTITKLLKMKIGIIVIALFIIIQLQVSNIEKQRLTEALEHLHNKHQLKIENKIKGYK
jgi:uncharacterized membrane protein (Fun14 family)